MESITAGTNKSEALLAETSSPENKTHRFTDFNKAKTAKLVCNCI